MADYVRRNDKQCKIGMDEDSCHRQTHYADVTVQRSRYVLGFVGTRADDVAGALRTAILVLQGKPPEGPPHFKSKREALIVLVHLVGDLHQPLHVGSLYLDPKGQRLDPDKTGLDVASFTVGGNSLWVVGAPKPPVPASGPNPPVTAGFGPPKLHTLWDGVPDKFKPQRVDAAWLAQARQVGGVAAHQPDAVELRLRQAITLRRVALRHAAEQGRAHALPFVGKALAAETAQHAVQADIARLAIAAGQDLLRPGTAVAAVQEGREAAAHTVVVAVGAARPVDQRDAGARAHVVGHARADDLVAARRDRLGQQVLGGHRGGLLQPAVVRGVAADGALVVVHHVRQLVHQRGGIEGRVARQARAVDEEGQRLVGVDVAAAARAQRVVDAVEIAGHAAIGTHLVGHDDVHVLRVGGGFLDQPGPGCDLGAAPDVAQQRHRAGEAALVAAEAGAQRLQLGGLHRAGIAELLVHPEHEAPLACGAAADCRGREGHGLGRIVEEIVP
ncbi:hypothetical protein OSTOST_14242, partial [Ostertagia ostertagi]